MPELREISRYCSGLVVIVPQKWEPDESTVTSIQLAHASVKDYVLSELLPEELTQHFRETVAHTSITKICLAYMSSVESHINTNPLSMRLNKLEMKTLFALGDFAGQYWEHYARHAETQRDVQEIILGFLLQERHGFAVWMNMFRPHSFAAGSADRPTPPLCLASAANLPVTVKLLLERRAAVNAQGPGGSALQEACYHNHKIIVQLLLQSEADVNLPCDRYGSALQSACVRGHQEIVQLLLAKGADVNLENLLGGTALIHASYRGDKEIVLLLLEHGADVNKVSGLHGTALQKASFGGHIAVVQLLLKHGADVNVWDHAFHSPLRAAVRQGHEETVQLLLYHGADDGRTPVSEAST
ncbi:hypothetical protein N8T08_008475 [Aspergillus melleus]|uniref:Uncharacterized protein n=1 Tax=Aspergillus melleus TaxID=138277 RepID=A0ACC3AVX9_9EURO|nr:hypothetical protein N8T08_008475 [Aspergillus melleus]